ncbi:hypothetical protein PILCRDRAFT_17297 [Piloderma croceum F 1598]|uniref:Uncharacterized protein n=1 Tax=Piloderma croceum (strain F 1598) TaxID=765440 RepID=A0A0C3ETR7_PILCF|nr:hypothetical protein PILCRDRAFT_17297 [Piloderma croceum F 1598]
MSFSTHFNPFLNLQLPAPVTEGTLPYPLIATRPSTPLPDDSAGSLMTISSPLSSLSADDNPLHDNKKPYPSINIEIMWNRVLQTNLKEDNVESPVSPLYVKDTLCPNRVGAWFMVRSGRLGRAYPSDETRLRSGVALRLEDRSISIHMLTDECPIHYIHLKKPIRRERGYVFYEFISDLYSHFRTPQPTKPPTNLIAIPIFHASDEAAHLNVQEATFHQQVLEEDYVIAPLRTWDKDPLTLSLEKQTWFKQKEPRPREKFDWFTSSEDNIRAEVAQILKAKESGSG